MLPSSQRLGVHRLVSAGQFGRVPVDDFAVPALRSKRCAAVTQLPLRVAAAFAFASHVRTSSSVAWRRQQLRRLHWVRAVPVEPLAALRRLERRSEEDVATMSWLIDE